MTMAPVDVDTIILTDEFDRWLGGQVTTGTMKLAPAEWNLDAKPALQYALDRIISHLRGRTPPVLYTDLEDPSELKLGIMYGAAEHLYQLAQTTGNFGDIYPAQRQAWEQKFDSWLSGFAPTLTGGLRGASGLSIPLFRR